MRGRSVGFNEKTVAEFDAKKGRGVGPWGDNLLLLTATGCVSGERITTPLVYRRHGGDFVLVASRGGAPEHPKWYGNLRANPEVEIEMADGDGTQTVGARARLVPEGPERDELYAYMVEVWPAFADYEKKTDRKIPIVVLTPIE